MSYSSLLPKLQVRMNMPVGRVKVLIPGLAPSEMLKAEVSLDSQPIRWCLSPPPIKRRLKDTLPKDKVELDELRVDLASLRRGFCAKHFHLYKAVGKEDLYCAPILMRTQIAGI
uniref:Uncharacterized protein n=2 Tax=Oryza TaxID=4527 RepID=A0A0D3F4T4_9ORYZ